MTNIYGAGTSTGVLFIAPTSTLHLLRLEMSATPTVPAIAVLRVNSGFTLEGNPVDDYALADGVGASGCTLRDAEPVWSGTSIASFDSGHGPNDVSALGITIASGDGLMLVSEDDASPFGRITASSDADQPRSPCRNRE